MPPAYLKAGLPSQQSPYRPGCTGKVRFDSPAIAASVIARPNHRDREAYRCQFCNGWHLGRYNRNHLKD